MVSLEYKRSIKARASSRRNTMEFLGAVGTAAVIEIVKLLMPALFQGIATDVREVLTNLVPLTATALEAIQKLMTSMPRGF